MGIGNTLCWVIYLDNSGTEPVCQFTLLCGTLNTKWYLRGILNVEYDMEFCGINKRRVSKKVIGPCT